MLQGELDLIICSLGYMSQALARSLLMVHQDLHGREGLWHCLRVFETIGRLVKSTFDLTGWASRSILTALSGRFLGW